MKTLYHITTREQAYQASKTGEYSPASLVSEGFIHLSQEHQVLKVANLFYKNAKGLVCLAIDPAKLSSPVKLEAPAHPDGTPHDELPDSELFPHLFGTLNYSAVIGLLKLTQDETGTFIGMNEGGNE